MKIPRVRIEPAISVVTGLAMSSVVMISTGWADDASAPIMDQRNVSVLQRPRPAYDAIGIHSGAFTVFPQTSVSESYDDNIYAATSNPTDDFITKLGARIDVNSNWSRHALNLTGGVSKSMFATHSGENRLDWNVGANGELDVTRMTQITGGVSYAQLHEDRGEPNAPTAAAEPTEYHLTNANAALAQQFNRLIAKLSGTYSKYDYNDVSSISGTTIDQDYRDREDYVEAARLGYEISPDTNVYVEGAINQRDYRLRPPTPGIFVDRNSDGYSAVVGSEFRVTDLAQGTAYIGYQKQNYDDPSFGSIDGLDYGAGINWFVTPLTTVGLNASSTVEETVIATSSGYLAQSVGLTVDHELLRNVILSGGASYENDDYQDDPRRDNVYGAGAGVKYLVNQYFFLGLRYDYTKRDSNQAATSYTRNVVGLTLTGQL